MTPTLLYMIGEPGIGKTTTMAVITAHLTLLGVTDTPFTHTLYGDHPDGHVTTIEIGKHRPIFGGTDALAMSVITRVETWLHTTPPVPLLLGEGARLSNMRFLNAAAAAGYTVHIAHFTGDTLAHTRRTTRGTTQTDRYITGRRTASTNLATHATHAGHHVHTITPNGTPTEVAVSIIDTIESTP